MIDKILCWVFFLAFFLTGCSTVQPQAGTANLQQLQNLSTANPGGSPNSTVNAIREQGLGDIALSVGAQSGLAARAKQINDVLAKQTVSLDQTFNFNLLLLEHNVLPPVLVQGRDTLNLSSYTSIRLADRTFQIIKQARFVTTPPTWREYLWLSYKTPELPPKSLLPKTRQEKVIWDKYVAQGWHAGIRQADTIFSENLARLKQDYQGMVLYRRLLAQGMVSAPYVARTDLGVTGDESDLRINDQVLRITALPALQPNSKQWKPVMSN